MTVCEWALVIPLVFLAGAGLVGLDHDAVIVPYAVAQIVGVLAYLDQQHRTHWHGPTRDR